MPRSEARRLGSAFAALVAVFLFGGASPCGALARAPNPDAGSQPVQHPSSRPSGAGGPVGSSGGMPDPGRGTTPSPLARQAIDLAGSGAAEDRARLGALLLDATWLDRLDPPQAAAGIDPAALQLTAVLRAAARRAPEVLEGPAASPLYRMSDYRRAALLAASGEVSRPGPALISLWRDQLDPEADELETTVRALARGASRAGVRLLGEAFTSDAFDTQLVISWFRDPVLQQRQNPVLLAEVEDLLRSARLGPERRYALVEALFEYRPEHWYASAAAPPAPPSRGALGDDARQRLRAIADLAVGLGILSVGRRAQIEAEIASPPP